MYFPSEILIDFVFRTGKNYYPHCFLKNVNMLLKKKKMLKYITDDIEISSEEENSFEENYAKE